MFCSVLEAISVDVPARRMWAGKDSYRSGLCRFEGCSNYKTHIKLECTLSAAHKLASSLQGGVPASLDVCWKLAAS